MAETSYRQCILEKRDGAATLQQWSYIPDKYAVVGKTLRLKDGETWTDGWLVKHAGPKETAEFVAGASRMYLALASIENSFA